MKYAAVIAAAGLSSRMREFKPILCLGENTMIESVIHNLREANVDEIVVVTGYKSDILRRHLKPLDVRVCENLHFAETKMFESLCWGLRAVEKPYDAVFLTPGDVPLVQPETIRKMHCADAGVVRPVCGERLGHPVLLKSDIVGKVLQYSGRNGLQGAIDSLNEPVFDLKVDDKGVVMDADTPEDFKALHRLKMNQRSSGRLWSDIHIHIAKGDTILTPETAQFLEMIDHTGSIQSACACVHISYTRGWKLLNQIERELGYPLVARFPGGASGGGSRLTDKGKQLLDAYQRYRDAVRETAETLFAKIFTEDLHG